MGLIIWCTLIYPVKYLINGAAIEFGPLIGHSNKTWSMRYVTFQGSIMGMGLQVAIALQENASAASCISVSVAGITVTLQNRNYIG